MPKATFELLLKSFDYLSECESLDWPCVKVPVERLVEFCAELKFKFYFDVLIDVSSIDWYDESPRFTVVYHFYSIPKNIYLRVLVDCVDATNPQVPSLADLWQGANWHERECFDMMGIRFVGHPDLRRILMWDEYPYHPLRKEFPLAGIEVEYPAADVVAQTGLSVKPVPLMGGPFVSTPGRPMSQMEPRGKDQSWTESNPKEGR